jgi:hypothetical protein
MHLEAPQADSFLSKLMRYITMQNKWQSATAVSS